MREEAASEVEVKRVAKICPNKACGARIEKISGCNHMTVSSLTKKYDVSLTSRVNSVVSATTSSAGFA